MIVLEIADLASWVDVKNVFSQNSSPAERAEALDLEFDLWRELDASLSTGTSPELIR